MFGWLCWFCCWLVVLVGLVGLVGLFCLVGCVGCVGWRKKPISLFFPGLRGGNLVEKTSIEQSRQCGSVIHREASVHFSVSLRGEGGRN